MKYKNNEIVKTGLTTTVRNKTAYLYKIIGDQGKKAEQRPFLVTISSAKDFINYELTDN